MPDPTILGPTSGKTFPAYQVSTSPTPSGPYLGSEAVRAQGSGPFDSAYRQNLATYGANQMFRPGGLLAYNPTDPSTFPSTPSGFGNAPVQGAGTGLLDMALSGNPFMYNQSQASPSGGNNNSSGNVTNPDNSWMDWLNNFNKQGSGLLPQSL